MPLTQFGGGGTAVGFGAGDQPAATVLSVAVDYTPFLNTLPNNFVPSTLQFWMTTNDDNRIYKAIDNVQLDGGRARAGECAAVGSGRIDDPRVGSPPKISITLKT